jgi:hypothetical protein
MRPSARAALLARMMRTFAMAGCAMVAGLLVIAPAARAETAYRYWTYWSVTDGSWSFSTIGPASAVPADGAIEGWRFAVTTAAGSAGDAPDSDPATAFTSICGGTAPVAGKKRVAIDVDFGLREDAPPGEQSPADIRECITADEAATGYELLRSMTDVRVSDGLICGIAAYPQVECAAMVEAPGPTSPGSAPVPESTVAAPESSSPGAPLISGLALLVAAIIGIRAWRRRDRG